MVVLSKPSHSCRGRYSAKMQIDTEREDMTKQILESKGSATSDGKRV